MVYWVYLTEKLVQLGYNVKAFVFYNSLGKWGWLKILILTSRNK